MFVLQWMLVIFASAVTRTYLPTYLPTSPISMKPSTALATQIVESEIDRSIDGMTRGEEIFKTL